MRVHAARYKRAHAWWETALNTKKDSPHIPIIHTPITGTTGRLTVVSRNFVLLNN